MRTHARVVSIVIVDPDDANMGSVEVIWDRFCPYLFFAPGEEAERWASGRDDVEILSVDETYELGRQSSSRPLASTGSKPSLGDADVERRPDQEEKR